MFRKLSIACIVLALATAAYAGEQEQAERHILRASTAIGLPVIDPEGEDLGTIDELVVCDEHDRISHAVVGVGGVLGVGATLHPVPVEAIDVYLRGIDPAVRPQWVAEIEISPDRLQEAPALEEDEWNPLADPEWTATLDEFYAAEPVEERGEREVHQASHLVGLSIYDRTEEEVLGHLDEIVFREGTGEFLYGVFAFGGLLGIGEEWFAVPWESLTPVHPVEDEPVEHLRLEADVDQEALGEMEGFPQQAWPRTADERFLPVEPEEPVEPVEPEEPEEPEEPVEPEELEEPVAEPDEEELP